MKAEKHRVVQDLDAPHHALDDVHHPSIQSNGCLAIQQDSLSCHDPPADQLLTDDSESVLSQEDDLDITLCRDNPSAVISQSQLSQSDHVFYHEENDTPGVCVSRGDGSFSWSPVKFSRSACKVGEPTFSEDSDIDIAECLCIDYESLGGTPGFSVETVDDVFWAPVAHRTRKRLKPPAEL